MSDLDDIGTKMAKLGLTNDDLVAFLERKKQSEVYQGWTEAEILERECTKLRFTSTLFFAAAFGSTCFLKLPSKQLYFLVVMAVLLAVAIPISLRERRMTRYAKIFDSRTKKTNLQKKGFG